MRFTSFADDLGAHPVRHQELVVRLPPGNSHDSYLRILVYMVIYIYIYIYIYIHTYIYTYLRHQELVVRLPPGRQSLLDLRKLLRKNVEGFQGGLPTGRQSVLNLRTTTSQKCGAVPRRARI